MKARMVTSARAPEIWVALPAPSGAPYGTARVEATTAPREIDGEEEPGGAHAASDV
ncbi:hypothetical protein [Microtetraspora glauca]|uniref:Uncharacterized protein n=1 Tax=Microtetraspora glauca TaxID=1996 RepID=A0ABV3GKS7_MICGL